MSIKFREVTIAIETMTCTAYDPEYNRVDREGLDRYLKEHPFPKDDAYSEEDLRSDLLRSSGAYILPQGIRTETKAYIEDLLNELVK